MRIKVRPIVVLFMGRRGKRVFEKDIDSDWTTVSPPNKMAKNINSAKADEILAKLSAMEVRFIDLQKEVAEITKSMKELDILKKEVAEIKESSLGFQRLEIENKKRSVLIRGVEFGTGEKYESRVQTKEGLAKLFNKLGMKPYLVDYQRMGGRRGDEEGSKIAIRVQFMDVDQKLELFDKMRVVGGEMRNISILTDYPSFQIPEFKRLSEVGYKIRTETPGTRTRVVPRGLGLILQRRANNTERWTQVSN